MKTLWRDKVLTVLDLLDGKIYSFLDSCIVLEQPEDIVQSNKQFQIKNKFCGISYIKLKKKSKKTSLPKMNGQSALY